MTQNSEKTDSVQTDPSRCRSGVVILGFALLSAVVLLIADGANSPLSLDEHVSYWISGKDNPGSLVERSLDYSATPPLTFLVQRLFLSEPQPQPYQLRLVSWFGFLLGVGCVFLAGRDLGGTICGGSAALILAWNPEILDLMRVGRPYGLSAGLSALSLWALIKLCDHPHSLVRAGILGISQVLLIWTHYVNLPLVAMQWVLLLFDKSVFRVPSHDSAHPRAMTLCLVITGLSVIPLFPAILRMHELSDYLNYRLNPVGLFELIHPFWWIGFPAGLLAVLALSCWKKTAVVESVPRRRHVLSSFVVMGVLPVLALWGASQWWEPTLGETRYRVVYAPVLALLAAFVFQRTSKLINGPLLGAIVALAVSWTANENLPWQSRLLSDPASKDWQIMAENVQQNSTGGDPIFVYSGLIESQLVQGYFDDQIFVDYVCCRMGRFYIKGEHPRVAIPYSTGINAELLDYYYEQIQQTHQNGRSIWLAVISDTDRGQDAERKITRLVLSRGFEVEHRVQQTTSTLIQFRPTNSSSSKHVP